MYFALAVFIIAWAGYRVYMPAFRAAGGRPMSYYDQFGPAVMAACGRGFVNPTPQPGSPLEAFLAERAGEFDCRSLGPDVRLEALNSFQAVTRNLLLSAAAIWRLAGIRWTALDNLAATMFALTLTAAYMVMRIVLGRSLALAGVVAWGISPMHLENAPHLRDYSKAPFFVLTALAIAVAIRTRRPKAMIALGVAYGIVQGLGLGMRTDVVLNFAPFFLALLVLGSGELKTNLSWKFVTIGASLVSFVVVAWPILTTYHRAEGLWHVSLLGLTTPFDNALGIRNAPYDFGYLYDDSYMSTVVQAYWYRVHDAVQVSLHESGVYDRACRDYYMLLASTFPADFLTRMMGSALHVLNLPFSISYGLVPLGVTNAVLTWLARARAFVMLALIGFGPLATLYVLVLLGMRSRAGAVVAFVLLGFWTTYPYLQFQGRHVFHLEVMVIFVLLWAVKLTRETFFGAGGAGWLRDGRRVRQSVLITAALLGCVVVCIAIARHVQRPRVAELLQRYASAPEERVDTGITTVGGAVRLTPAVFEKAERRVRIQQAMLILDVTAACTLPEVPVHVRYQAAEPDLDFSRDLTVHVSPNAGTSRVFVPVYSVERADGSASRFVSIETPAEAAPCVRVARAPQLERSAVMLDTVLPSDWREHALYERVYLGPTLPERIWLRVARWFPRVAELG